MMVGFEWFLSEANYVAAVVVDPDWGSLLESISFNARTDFRRVINSH